MLTVEIKSKLKLFLRDDLRKGDVTSALIPVQNCTAVVIAKENCTLAGLEELTYLFQFKKCKVKFFAKDGQAVKKGRVIAKIGGNNRIILGVERTALNVLSRMSGIATACTRARKLMGNSKTILALTRKTVPGFNVFDKRAAFIAGVRPHRLNLSSGILVKDNHLKFFPDVFTAVLNVKHKAKNKLIEIEVENLRDAVDAVLAGADTVMLDNFSVSTARKTIASIKSLNSQTRIELSGGITFNNLKKYSNLGADIVSMGALTHSVQGINFSLEIEPVKR